MNNAFQSLNPRNSALKNFSVTIWLRDEDGYELDPRTEIIPGISKNEALAFVCKSYAATSEYTLLRAEAEELTVHDLPKTTD